MSTTPLIERDPIRVIVVGAGALTAAGTCLVSISQGVPVLAAVGTALLALGTIVGGGELARSKAWAPATVNELVDAHTVIDGLEQRGS